MEVSNERTVIAGRYELESLVGEGGMGNVWQARDLTLARPVAVKLLYGRDERDQALMLKRFLREARIAAAVQHRNVIHIVDFGTTRDGLPFMVMELLRGETLNARLDKSPPLDMAAFVTTVGMTLRGLSAVHEAGIVHRDLKPDNIYLTKQDEGLFPKILDFGISRSIEPASGRRSALTTKEGLIVGTPEYMSPEQARGIRGIDHRTDIYSVGVILYEGLTGELPYDSENVGDLIIQIVTGTTPRADHVNEEVPTVLADVIEKAMSHKPDDRFGTALEMQQALLAAAEQCSGEDIPTPLSERPARFRDSVASDRVPIPGGRPVVGDRGAPVELLMDALAEEAESREHARPHSGASFPVSLTKPPPPAASRPKPPGQGAAAASHTRSPRRPAVLAAGGTLVLLTVAVGAFGLRADPKPAVTTLPDTHIAATIPTPKATLQLIDVPEEADVRVDGRRHTELPLVFPRDGKSRVISINVAGMQPWTTTHAVTGDARLKVALTRLPRPARRHARTRAARVRAAARAQPSKVSKRPKPTRPAKPASRPAAERDRPPSAPRALRNLDF